MPTLTMCKGLPGSGKTTWTRDQLNIRRALIFGTAAAGGESGYTPIQRVNKDDIRTELEGKGWKWSHDNEKDVVDIRDMRIRHALLDGMDVISDDTNFGKHETNLLKIAVECKAEFVVKDFTGVPIEECIRRDAGRLGKARVGEEVIRKMAKQNGIRQVNPRKYEANPDCMPAIICDLDGTLCLHNGRSPYDTAQCANDLLNVPVLDVIRTFCNRGYQIIYLSGRDEEFRTLSKDWLNDHNCPPGPLWMRARGDKREDSIVKSELFDRHVRDRYNVKFVLDDRNRVVDMWRSMGLTVFQVADGDF